jgi:hypothetical protein
MASKDDFPHDAPASYREAVTRVRRCVSCGSGTDLIGGHQFSASPTDAAFAVYACRQCLRDADFLINAPWAPPLYLTAVLTRNRTEPVRREAMGTDALKAKLRGEPVPSTIIPDVPFLEAISSERRTVALRATLLAHKLLAAAERAVNPNTGEALLRDVTAFVNRQHVATKKTDPRKGNGLRTEAELAALDALRHCSQDPSLLGDLEEEVAAEFLKLQVFYPELNPDEGLFEAAVRLWMRATYDDLDPDDPADNKWEATWRFLRLPDPAEASTPAEKKERATRRATLRKYWERREKARIDRKPPATEDERRDLVLRLLTESNLIGLDQRPKQRTWRLDNLETDAVALEALEDFDPPDDADPNPHSYEEGDDAADADDEGSRSDG